MRPFGRILAVASLCIAVAACASNAKLKEDMLSASGFKATPPKTPSQIASFNSLPPHKLTKTTHKGKTVWVYSDPVVCGCLYIGDQHEDIRHFTIKIGGEAVRVGQALGYHIEKIGKMEPETLAKASEGDKAALDEIETILRPGSNTNPNPRADIQRPSMAQDIRKGRRTEIEFMNGYIADRGSYIGVPAPTHTKLTEIVKKVERREVKAAPALLGG